MARTTGYTCTAALNMIADRLYDKKGVSPPEYIGVSENNFRYISNYLNKRNVDYKMKKIILN